MEIEEEIQWFFDHATPNRQDQEAFDRAWSDKPWPAFMPRTGGTLAYKITDAPRIQKARVP